MAKASKGAPTKAGKAKSGGNKAAASAPPKPAVEPAAKPAAKAPKPEQLSLDAGAAMEEGTAQVPAKAEAPPPTKAETPARKAASEGGSPVAELVIGAQGTWKKLASGKKVPIDEKEWQLELGRMLAKKTPPETPPTEN